MSKEIPREKFVSLEGKQKIVVNYNSLIKEYKKKYKFIIQFTK